MKNIMISYIVSVYNVGKYLENCLDTLVGLRRNDCEIILVDDGSTDHSGDICDQYAKKDDRFRVIHQENQGVSVARNTGLNMACGKWIFFVDGDDMIIPENIEDQIIPALDETCQIVYYMRNIFIDDIVRVMKPLRLKQELIMDRKEDLKEIEYCMLSPYTSRFRELNEDTIFSVPWCKLYLRECIENNQCRNVPGIVRAQDLLFNIEVLQYTDKVKFLPYKGYVYRERYYQKFPYRKDLIQKEYQLLGYLNKLYRNNGDKRAKECLNIFSANRFMQVIRLDLCNIDNMDTYRKRKLDFQKAKESKFFLEAFNALNRNHFSRFQWRDLWYITHNQFWIISLYNRRLFYIIRFMKKQRIKIERKIQRTKDRVVAIVRESV